jgi:hypothetical protein
LAIEEEDMGKISVLLPEADDARFCAYCRKSGHKKSTFIAHLIKEHLDKERIGTDGLPLQMSSAPRPGRHAFHHHASGLKSRRGT